MHLGDTSHSAVLRALHAAQSGGASTHVRGASASPTAATPVVAPAPAGTTVPATGAADGAATLPANDAPVVWTEDIRSAFRELGVPDAQIAELEALQPTEQELIGVYEQLVTEISASQQGAATSGSAPAGATGPVAGSDGAGSQVSSIPTGPPAWNEEWRQKFLDLGTPPEILGQLTLTGAMGYDEKQLQQLYSEVKTSIDSAKAELKKDLPEQYEKLEESDDKDMLANMAVQYQAARAQGMSEERLRDMIDMQLTTAKSMEPIGIGKQVLGMAAWNLIPGFGLLSWAMGKDPIMGYRIDRTPWSGDRDMMSRFTDWMALFSAVGGAFAVGNSIKSGLAASQGMNIVQSGTSDLANAIAKGAGMDDAVTGWTRLKGFLPFTQEAKTFSGIAHFGDDVLQAGSRLTGDARLAWDHGLDLIRQGKLTVTGSSNGIAFAPMGMAGASWRQNTRGALLNRKAPFTSIRPGAAGALEMHIGPQVYGSKAAAAQIAAGFAETLPVSKSLVGDAAATASAMSAAKRIVLNQAATDLNLAGELTGIRSILARLRPSPVLDAIKGGHTAGLMSSMPKGLKYGLIGAGVIGGGMLMGKLMMGGAQAPPAGAPAGADPAAADPAAATGAAAPPAEAPVPVAP